jgi:hypothetical protein
LYNGVKTHFICAAMINDGQIYTDQTGCFPVVSRKGNTYIMILCEYEDNAILEAPIKTAAELLRAFQVLEQKLTSIGLTPRLMGLDNEASQLLKNYLY